MQTNDATLQADIVDEGTNVLEYLQIVEKSEPGSVFIGKDGYFNFQQRTQDISSTAVKTFADDDLVFALVIAIKFFEQKEEYEKCAHLKQIQDIVEKFIK